MFVLGVYSAVMRFKAGESNFILAGVFPEARKGKQKKCKFFVILQKKSFLTLKNAKNCQY